MKDAACIKNKIKKALMIPIDSDYADEEIELHLNSCKSLILSAGVSEKIVESEDGLVLALILIYSKTFFGFKSDGSVKELPASFDLLLRQLVLTNRG